jgi:hypothetical protein
MELKRKDSLSRLKPKTKEELTRRKPYNRMCWSTPIRGNYPTRKQNKKQNKNKKKDPVT